MTAVLAVVAVAGCSSAACLLRLLRVERRVLREVELDRANWIRLHDSDRHARLVGHETAGRASHDCLAEATERAFGIWCCTVCGKRIEAVPGRAS